MILKTGLEVAQDYNVSKYGPPSPQKDSKSQDIKIVIGQGMMPSHIFYPRAQQREN